MSERLFFDGLLAVWLALAAAVFLILLRVDAPYGRHRRPGWGPSVPATAGWIVMESPAVLLFALFFALGEHRGAGAAALLALWQIHYLHRAFVFPWRRRDAGGGMPLSVAAMALVFNVVNAYLNGRYLFTLGPTRGAEWLRDPRFLAGAALFAGGMALNLWSDDRLFRLRRPGERGYRIPRQGPFRLVSCPNYLGEILEWCGWALASWSPAGLAFAFWTAANLAPRALAHHRWYRRRFPDYPPERRALIPFLL